MTGVIKRGNKIKVLNYIDNEFYDVVAISDEYSNTAFKDDDEIEAKLIEIKFKDDTKANAIWIEKENLWELVEGSWYY